MGLCMRARVCGGDGDCVGGWVGGAHPGPTRGDEGARNGGLPSSRCRSPCAVRAMAVPVCREDGFKPCRRHDGSWEQGPPEQAGLQHKTRREQEGTSERAAPHLRSCQTHQCPAWASSRSLG